ncbi:MAG: alpha/beta fold hydrolase [Actinomycetota bacterium]|nr:alpha/beta fold hydrolase [Actinomycetota bacterium]
MQERRITLHGHEVTYRTAGDGEQVVVLIHGITGSSQTWADAMPALAEHYTVVAPDLLGHGQSAKPVGDYSLGAYASGIRDLLGALGHDRATVVGHSLGGGVAMQFAYQFPERCERLVLVSSGGLGREVHLLLRAATLPGAEFVLPVITAAYVASVGDAVGGLLGRIGLRGGPDLEEMWRGFASLSDVEARAAFVHTLRTIVEPSGQRVSALDRLYLAAEMPMLLIWGERDPIIPVSHGEAAAAAAPGSRLVVFPGVRHFPHREKPARFLEELIGFMESTAPADVQEDRWRALLRFGAVGSTPQPAR